MCMYVDKYTSTHTKKTVIMNIVLRLKFKLCKRTLFKLKCIKLDSCGASILLKNWTRKIHNGDCLVKIQFTFPNVNNFQPKHLTSTMTCVISPVKFPSKLPLSQR